MSAMKKNIRRYTLLEIIVVIAFVAILMNSALLLYYKAKGKSMAHIEKAVHIKSVSAVADIWRKFVHDNGNPAIIEPDKIVFKNKSGISAVKDKLIFATVKDRRQFVLPNGYSAEFALERNSKEPPCLVLKLKEPKGSSPHNKFTRIVAGIKEKP